jgi:putative hydrolase of the HAD superfamily
MRQGHDYFMVTHLIFDFFGTLVHYTPGRFHELPYEKTYQLLRDQSITISYEEFVRHFSSTFQILEQTSKETLNEFHMYEVVTKFFLKTFDMHINKDYLHSFTESYIQEWNRGTVFLPDITNFISNIATQYNISILSNTHYPDLVHRNLKQMGIANYFSHVLTSVEYGKRKPHASIFQEMLNRLQISVSQAVYIGDTYEDDYVGATTSGLRCILIDSKQKHANSLITRVDSLFDVPRFIKRDANV